MTETKKEGRPTTYTPELAAYVCKTIATHACGLKKLTKMYDAFPSQSTIYAWIYDHPEFSGQYMEARRVQATVLADSMLDIPTEIPIYEDKEGNDRIDAGMLGRAKLDCDILKWHASKMAPKVFGDHKQVEDLQAENERVKQELAEVRAKLNAQNVKEY